MKKPTGKSQAELDHDRRMAERIAREKEQAKKPSLKETAEKSKSDTDNIIGVNKDMSEVIKDGRVKEKVKIDRGNIIARNERMVAEGTAESLVLTIRVGGATYDHPFYCNSPMRMGDVKKALGMFKATMSKLLKEAEFDRVVEKNVIPGSGDIINKGMN